MLTYYSALTTASNDEQSRSHDVRGVQQVVCEQRVHAVVVPVQLGSVSELPSQAWLRESVEWPCASVCRDAVGDVQREHATVFEAGLPPLLQGCVRQTGL